MDLWIIKKERFKTIISEDKICSLKVSNSQIVIWLASSLVKHQPRDPTPSRRGLGFDSRWGNVFGRSFKG
jgi:hypothetical protein